MPLTHERTFRVRHYECDAAGQVHHANLLRYMQEAAMDASAAADYDLARYEALHTQWLIRETDLRVLRPLHYGDSVTVRTYVNDFRRVRSRRAYELRDAASGEPVARAHTDWIYMDTDTLRPITVPDEMIAAFFPEGPAAAPAMPRDPFPTPPPPRDPFGIRRRVAWSDLDTARHVNNAMYLAYIEDCTVQALAAVEGWPAEAPEVLHYRIEYQQPALLDDEVEIMTWTSDNGGGERVRHYTITRVEDGVQLARARVVWQIT